ncbi:unnamed protein product [Mytilus coruscus]|uniref:Chitin-binding type-2 domain-containing protein n=1 Tax=Mytilus coruscus TaxID=42192 RepID=A0A6J8C9F9_MYTCO|nr:unnamed protein product [Mytilus coruscus]
MLCIIITASVAAVATFFAKKHVLSGINEKCAFNTEDASCPVSCPQEPCDNEGTCVNGACSCNDGFAGSKCKIDVNQTCKFDANTLIPHPNICQLYYNCSQAVSPFPIDLETIFYSDIPQVIRPAYLHECPYPEFFSTNMSCQNYTDMKCGCRYETKNKFACKLCKHFNPDCVGFADGIHRNRYMSTPEEEYFECQDERNIYSGHNPCPKNMVPYNGKCTDLFEIKPSNWQRGYAIDCSNRTNGNYKSEHVQRCDIYYTCVNGNSTLTYCDSELVFDSKSSFCQNKTNVCTPCGSVVHCC